MCELLRNAGLEIRNENNQYEDHIGLELLFLPELCRRRAEGEDDQLAGDAVCGDVAMLAFVNKHPLSWIGALHNAVRKESPQGYIDGVLGVAESLLGWLSESLKRRSASAHVRRKEHECCTDTINPL